MPAKGGLMNTGLLVVRAVIRLVLVGHGVQKLFGWFGGSGLTGAGEAMGAVGYRPGTLFAFVAGATEAGGGLLLALGLLTPLAAAAIVGTMLNAALSAHVKKGFWLANGGYEYILILVGVAAVRGFTGAGPYRPDHASGWSHVCAAGGLCAVAVVLPSGMVTALFRLRDL